MRQEVATCTDQGGPSWTPLWLLDTSDGKRWNCGFLSVSKISGLAPHVGPRGAGI